MIPKRSSTTESLFPTVGCNNCGKCNVCTQGLTTPPACEPEVCGDEQKCAESSIIDAG